MGFVMLCDRCGSIDILERPPPDKRPLCNTCAGRLIKVPRMVDVPPPVPRPRPADTQAGKPE